jgi:hypothetical protein
VDGQLGEILAVERDEQDPWAGRRKNVKSGSLRSTPPASPFSVSIGTPTGGTSGPTAIVTASRERLGAATDA